MTNLSALSVSEGAGLALKVLLHGKYLDDVTPDPKYTWRTPYVGTFGQWFSQSYRSDFFEDEEVTAESENSSFDNQRLWQHLKYEGKDATMGEYSAKVVAEYGGEGDGDQYWMVVSISDGLTTRYFRRDGWYASYDAGYLDGDTTEVRPAEKTVVVYE